MWQVGSVCYQSPALANAVTASTVRGSIVDYGGVPHIVDVAVIGDTGVEYTLQPIGGGTPIVQQLVMDPLPCGLLTISDVQPLAWAVLAGWVGIFMIKQLWAAAHGGRDDA